MISIIPIAKTQVDWTTYLQACFQILGRSVTRGIDQNKQSVGSLTSFLQTLAEFKNENANSITSDFEAGALLRQINISFLWTETRAEILLEVQPLKIIAGERCAVVSGNLEEWRDAIINNCNEDSDFDLRLALDKTILYFESIGLGQLFMSYHKETLRDHTFKLIENK